MQELNTNENFINFVGFPKKHVKILKEVAGFVLKSEKKRKYQINFIMLNDKEIKKMNMKYRKVRRITDVISFLIIPEIFAGDIYISKSRTQKQAKRYANSWEQELAYLVIHGMLHLCGYTDYDVENKSKMFAKQDKIFNVYFHKFNCLSF